MKIRMRHGISILSVLLGSLLYAVAVNSFFIPHKLLSGGVAGIAILSHYLTGMSTGLLILIINIPIFVIGYRFVDRLFVMSSAIGMLGLSGFLALTQFMQGWQVVDDILLAAVFGGAIGGFGMGLVFRNRGSLGGTDIIAVILKRYFSINIGSVLFYSNMVIVLLSALSAGLKPALYTLISMYISTNVLDQVQTGWERKKAVFIISERHDEIAKQIMSEVGRGVTLLQGEGAYSHHSKVVLYTVLSLTQLAKVKLITERIDHSAFLIINDATEVLGKGFKNYEDGL